MRFAQQTGVSPERTRAEIEVLLRRYQASSFGYATDNGQAMVQFRLKDRVVRFLVPLPKIDGARKTPTGRIRRSSVVPQFLAREERQRWRALLLVIKAKLEAVETGIATFEEEFLAHIVMPDGRTVGQHVLPAVAVAYESGKMPKGLLPAWGVESESQPLASFPARDVQREEVPSGGPAEAHRRVVLAQGQEPSASAEGETARRT